MPIANAMQVLFGAKLPAPKVELQFALSNMEALIEKELIPPPTLRETLIAHADNLNDNLLKMHMLRAELAALISNTEREIQSLTAAAKALSDDPTRL